MRYFCQFPLLSLKQQEKNIGTHCLKARAIENFCYIFAPAQGGKHYNRRETYGHTMVVSPDGKILKEMKISEGVITVKVNPLFSKKLRKIIPSLSLE